MKTIISTLEAPAAIGPYAQAVRVGNMVYTSGQLGLDPATGEMVSGIHRQTERVLRNLEAILEAADSDMDHVVKTTVFLLDMDHFTAMNEVYERFFGDHVPARSCVQVGIPKGGLVEIEAVAVVAPDSGPEAAIPC